MTNILVEGGGRLLGSLFDAQLVDEVHVFVAPTITGGAEAPTPVAGIGVEKIAQGWSLENAMLQTIGSDLYCHGRVRREQPCDI